MTGYRDAVVKLVWQLVRLRGDEANSLTTDASRQMQTGVEVALAAFIGEEACEQIVTLIHQNYRDLAAQTSASKFVFEKIDAVLANIGPIAPEDIAPVHPRPSRHELLAAVEKRMMNAAASVPATLDGQEAIARSILVLAQARALL